MAWEYRQRMRVAWADTDASGRIHFTAAFRWAEIAEHAMVRELRLDDVGEFPRRHVEATFHRPLRFPDEFDLVLAPERIGRTSVTYGWRAERDGETYVEGRFVVVLVGDDGMPRTLPETFRQGWPPPPTGHHPDRGSVGVPEAPSGGLSEVPPPEGG